MADEQNTGLHHVWPLLRVPGGQRPPRRQSPRVPCLYLMEKPYLEPTAWMVAPGSGLQAPCSLEKRQLVHSPGRQVSLLGELEGGWILMGPSTSQAHHPCLLK